MYHKEKNNHTCDQFRRNLFAFQEKELPGDTLANFEDHLRSCHDCSSVYTDFLDSLKIIDQKKNLDPNPFISTRINQFLEFHLGNRDKTILIGFRKFLQPVSVTFLLLIAVLIGFSLIYRKNPRYSDLENRKETIQLLQSDLNIADLMDEEKTLYLQP